MAMTQRRELTPDTAAHLTQLRDARDHAADAYKHAVVEALDEASIRQVMAHTGLSMDTIQRWRRDLEQN